MHLKGLYLSLILIKTFLKNETPPGLSQLPNRNWDIFVFISTLPPFGNLSQIFLFFLVMPPLINNNIKKNIKNSDNNNNNGSLKEYHMNFYCPHLRRVSPSISNHSVSKLCQNKFKISPFSANKVPFQAPENAKI